MSEDAIHIGRLLKMVNEAIEREVNNDMRPRGITAAQMHVLMELHKSTQGELGFKQLKGTIGVSQPTTWGIVSRLEHKGLVETLSSPTDARAKYVRITDEGRALCETARSEMEEHERRLTSSLTPEETEQLCNLLLRVHESFVKK